MWKMLRKKVVFIFFFFENRCESRLAAHLAASGLMEHNTYDDLTPLIPSKLRCSIQMSNAHVPEKVWLSSKSTTYFTIRWLTLLYCYTQRVSVCVFFSLPMYRCMQQHEATM